MLTPHRRTAFSFERCMMNSVMIDPRPGDGAPSGRPASSASARRGEEIRYGIGRASLGCVLVAASAKGVAAILLGDDPATLRGELGKRFRGASLRPAERELAGWLAAAVAMIDEPRRAERTSFPLDIRGTPFQRRVWDALRAIPVGETASYAAVAVGLGQPSAARAVAAACAANPLAVAISCHRVVA